MSILLKSPDNGLARIKIVGVCRTCKHYHKIDVSPDQFGQAAFDWEYKHRHCALEHPEAVEFLSPSRFIPRGFEDMVFEVAGRAPFWLDFKPNADLKIAYAASAAFTITLASLATSSTFLVGRESTVIDNSSNKYIDYRLTCTKITTGTTPTVDKDIRVYAHGTMDDTPTYLDVLTGADAGATITNAYILDSGLTLIGATSNSATSNVGYPIKLLTVAEAFGVCPLKFGLFVAHNTAVNLNSTGSNHVLSHKGIYFTAV